MNGVHLSGAIAVVNTGSLTVTKCTLSGNNATGIGGGIFQYAGGTSLTVTDSTLSGNTAQIGGGIFYKSTSSKGQLTVLGSTISGNQAINGQGGGLFCYGVNAKIANTTISGNLAHEAGGLYLRYPTTNVSL